MDLNLLPLSRQNGQDQPGHPGLLIATQPRRTARGRQSDRLVLYFLTAGNAPLTGEQTDQLLAGLAQTYYNTQGSVTAAMRTIAESTNQFMLDRNLRGAGGGRQSIGMLAILVMRQERLSLALCGSLTAFAISQSGVQIFSDAQATRRGLGLGKVTPIYYAQVDVAANDSLLVSPLPPPTWQPGTLAGMHGQGPESLRRRLLALAGPDLEAILLQLRPGSGKSYLLTPRPGAAVVETLDEPAAAAIPETPAPTETVPAFEISAAREEPHDPAPELDAVRPGVPAVDEPAPEPAPTPPAQAGRSRGRERRAAAPTPEKASRPAFPIGAAFRKIGGAFGEATARFVSALATLLRRMLPEESLFTLPVPVMFTTAVAVPLVVVAVASVVYFQRGRTAEFQSNYSKAVQAATFAREQTDPQTQRTAWIAVQGYLDEAEKYGKSQEAVELRSQAVTAYDALNLVQRLDYQPAITGGLPRGSNIIQVVATASDLFLLDSATGSAFRAFSTGLGYEIDNTFQCGPGFPGSGAAGSLVDISVLPAGDGGKAILVGIDIEGNVLQCESGEQPLFTVLPTPYTGWGEARGIAYDQGEIYIMDPAKSAVWIYNNRFSDQARPFFTGDPPDLSGVVDFAVQKGDLYLLHQDGAITLCVFTGMTVSPTQCSDLPSVDARPGLDNRPYLPETAYLQIIATQPPDPSLYLLEPARQALHHFSLRLAFQRQLRPIGELSTAAGGSLAPATAFTLTPDKRIAILAVGAEVFYAGMP